jgi:hypothetical protein
MTQGPPLEEPGQRNWRQRLENKLGSEYALIEDGVVYYYAFHIRMSMAKKSVAGALACH